MVAWRYEISLLVSRRNFVSPRGHVISSMYCIDCMVNSKIEDLREYTINGILTDFFKLCECTLVSSLHVLSTKKKQDGGGLKPVTFWSCIHSCFGHYTIR